MYHDYYHYPYTYDEDDERQFLFPNLFPGSPGGRPPFGGPGGPPGFPPPPPGPPGGPGGRPPRPGGGPPSGGPGGGQATPPTTPPPSFTPQQPQFQTFAVDPGAIRSCLFRFTYVWLRRDSFWFYPTFVGRNSVAGFRWSRFRWVYFGIDLDRIESFQCF